MLKGYKKSYLIINMLLSVLLVFLITNITFYKHTSYLFCILSLIIPFIIIVAIFGYERKKRRYMYELIFYTFAYSILFIIFTYILGLFIGFTQNVYKFDLNNIVQNVLPYALLIVVSELFRYEIVRKGDGSPSSYIMITLILIIIDMTLFLTTYDLSNGDAQIKYICSIVLPSVFKNVALIYFSKLGGPIPTIIYRFMFDLKLVIVPIFPNFGLYFDSIINCIVPAVLFAISEFHIRRDDRKRQEHVDVRKHFLHRYLLVVILVIGIISVNILGSGKFKYTMISIGSGSMSPKIEKGDAVIYERYDKNNAPTVGKILVFKKDNKVVVHRIIEIVDTGDNLIYYTKGDANESPDGYPIEDKDIVGVVVFRIKYVGIPSVIIGEAIAK